MATDEADGGGKKDAAGPNAFGIGDPETFARNMACAVEYLGQAAAAWAEPRERGETTDKGPASAEDVLSTFSKVADYWTVDPARALEAQSGLFSSYLDIWDRTLRRMGGEDAPPSPAGTSSDRRFADPQWTSNIFFSLLKEVYLSTSHWAGDLVRNAGDLDEHTRQKAAFYVRQVAAALSPSNFLLTNPELYRETIASNGANLVSGMRMFAEDMAAGRGHLALRQADYSAFEVGRDMAATPGKVIAQNAICQIIQYQPTTGTVFKRPLLITPPWINKFYILDLNPQKSFIRWAVAEGHTVFVISWVNPDASHASKDWRDYIHEGVLFGLDTIEAATGEREVNAVGYCVGGTLLAAALAYLKAAGDDRIVSATFLATQVDFTHAGDLKVFVDEDQLTSLGDVMMAKGYLDGSRMAAAFNMLRAGDLIWPYFVDNYLKGRTPQPFDLLCWNADSTRMPRANHLFYLRNCYLENRLSAGSMEIGGRRLDLSAVDIPIYSLAAKDDHIAPALSVYVGSGFFGSDVTFVLTGSGHVGGVVNPPERRKYQYWTAPAPAPGQPYEEWLMAAAEHPGSWWPHWQDWIAPLSGGLTAARAPGGGKLPPLEDAPGSYVKVKA